VAVSVSVVATILPFPLASWSFKSTLCTVYKGWLFRERGKIAAVAAVTVAAAAAAYEFFISAALPLFAKRTALHPNVGRSRCQSCCRRRLYRPKPQAHVTVIIIGGGGRGGGGGDDTPPLSPISGEAAGLNQGRERHFKKRNALL